ncbi:ABC transporter ATP-binding protein [Chengkuizengella axinellae]|uniref:ATP-binding cassette domain-containing protein n=1 Tax=Chengkuizengella axinellae TaxID=3064388 RepID=A0ABT9J1M2_9BACL|nr:ATP-binding cassette domain-containing protein [Chengkuizengella sp. 2205SS18-9]MDP5275516.1 ATP-binding cassette domain-containing protein [Chengkuizengella sp. 2205SS18-9]
MSEGKFEESVISVEGLYKKYGQFIAVNKINFEVKQGEVFGLLGPNGAGKTTTMEMIEGLRKPDGGKALVAGFDTQKQLNKVKEVIGVQLQSTSLFDLLKVKEIAQMYASFYPNPLAIEPLLESVNLQEKMNDRVKNLSGGQKQRLAIALALVNDPKVIFLDEPTTGLDPQARRTLWDIILRLKQQGKTIILSTHYMDEAHILCDRICLVDQGNIIALNSPQELIKSLDSESAIEFNLSNTDVLKENDRKALIQEFKMMNAVKQVDVHNDTYILYTNQLQHTLTDLIQQADEKKINLADLQTRTATLEDVFIHMTGRSLREE